VTLEQRQVVAFMDRRGIDRVTYTVGDVHVIEISRQDIIDSKPLAEIFAAKIELYEDGDEAQRDPNLSNVR
jgi:hypothetical protein